MKHDDAYPSFRLSIYNLIFRNLYKIIYKYTHPKSLKHNRYYWPCYSVDRNSYGGIDKVFFKKKLVADNSLITSSQKKCMLVATGPSVKKIPKEAFYHQDIDYFGVNGAISLNDINFKYYVIIDRNFTYKRFDLVLKVLKSNCTFFTTPRCLDIILRKISPEDILCKIKIIEPITEGKIERFLGQRESVKLSKQHYFYENQKGFSINIQNAVFDYFTVAYVALQIIYSQGSKEIYLAGLDMNNFNHPRFYENNDNKQPTMLNDYMDELLPAFQVAGAFLKNKNIQVYNLSRDSAVTAFKKVDPIIFKGAILD